MEAFVPSFSEKDLLRLAQMVVLIAQLVLMYRRA